MGTNEKTPNAPGDQSGAGDESKRVMRTLKRLDARKLERFVLKLHASGVLEEDGLLHIGELMELVSAHFKELDISPQTVQKFCKEEAIPLARKPPNWDLRRQAELRSAQEAEAPADPSQGVYVHPDRMKWLEHKIEALEKRVYVLEHPGDEQTELLHMGGR